MKKISDLTYKIVAIAVDDKFDMDECVDWANEMINLGYTSYSLLILAGLMKPTNFFQTVEYLNSAIVELKLQIKVGDEAIISYSAYYIIKISQSENIKENLNHLYIFCLTHGYEKIIFDFYLLHWAWNDIQNNIEPSHYWENATQDNIEKIVVERAMNWVNDFEHTYIQNICCN